MECHKCKRSGIKLWRRAQSFQIDLTCYACSGDKRPIDAQGYVDSPFFPGVKTDQLCNSLVPAVPVDGESDTYWGYTSVPQDAAQRWRALPN